MYVNDDVTNYVETSDGLRLAVYEDGPSDAPVILFVHGYPDDHRVWDGVAGLLSDEFRVVRYDVRGAGRSGVPAARADYRIEQLNDDLGRVITAVSADAPVHVVAHDWGSIQTWDALQNDRLGVRIKSYTSISGPSLDYAAAWARRIHTGPISRLKQLVESYYIGFFMAPFLPEALARRGLVERGVRMSESIARPAALPATARFKRSVEDAVHGIELYRANVPRRFARPCPPVVTLPVRVIVPKNDVHVSEGLALGAPVPYVANLSHSVIDGNHWVVSQNPVVIARIIRSFVTSVGGNVTPIGRKDSAR